MLQRIRCHLLNSIHCGETGLLSSSAHCTLMLRRFLNAIVYVVLFDFGFETVKKSCSLFYGFRDVSLLQILLCNFVAEMVLVMRDFCLSIPD